MLEEFKSLTLIKSTGALLATFFSSSKVLDFFAKNIELFLISLISTYGWLTLISNSFEIRCEIIEL